MEDSQGRHECDHFRWPAMDLSALRKAKDQLEEALRAKDLDACYRAHLKVGNAMGEVEWRVHGVSVPESVWKVVSHADPCNQVQVYETAIEVIRAMADEYNLERVIASAEGRSELGRELAVRSRRKRDEAYLERVQWVAVEYERVRRRYPAGVSGDKVARLEVAQNYQRNIEPGWLMDDKTIRNLLRASRARATSVTSGKHGRNGHSGNLRH